MVDMLHETQHYCIVGNWNVNEKMKWLKPSLIESVNQINITDAQVSAKAVTKAITKAVTEALTEAVTEAITEAGTVLTQTKSNWKC